MISVTFSAVCLQCSIYSVYSVYSLLLEACPEFLLTRQVMAFLRATSDTPSTTCGL